MKVIRGGIVLILLMAMVLAYSCHSRKPQSSPSGETGTGQATDQGNLNVPPLPARPERSSPGALILIYTTAISGELLPCG